MTAVVCLDVTRSAAKKDSCRKTCQASVLFMTTYRNTELQVGRKSSVLTLLTSPQFPFPAWQCIALQRTVLATTLLANWESPELVLVVKARLEHRGSTCKGTPAWATHFSLRRCMPGTQFWKVAIL